MATLRVDATTGKQSGTVNMTTETTSITATLGTAVTLANSVLFWSYQGGTDAPSTASFRAYMSATDTITFERNSDDAGNNNVDFKWVVIQFSTGLTNQHFTFNDVDDGDTQAIDEIDTATAYIQLDGMKKGGSTFSADDECRIDFASTTSVQMHQGGSATTDMDIAFQVIDIDDADVQAVTSTASSSTATTLDNSLGKATVLADTYLVGSKENTAGAGFENLFWSAHLTSTTNLRIERDSAGSTTIEYTVFVVEVADCVVQAAEIEMDSSTTERNFDITAVSDLTLSVVFGTGLTNGWGQPNCVITSGSEQDYNRVFTTLDFVDADTVLADRDASSSSTISQFVNVVEFLEESGSDVPLSVTMAGTGVLATVFQVDVPMSPTLVGSGSLAVVTQVDSSFAPTFEGSGEVSIVSSVDVPFTATFVGDGELSIVFDVGGVTFAPTFVGTGTLAVTSSVDVPMSPTFSGVGTLVVVATTDAVETTVGLFGRYVVYDPTALGEMALRKIAYLRQRER